MAQTAQPADITAVQDILKEVYTSDTIESQIFDDALLLSQLERTQEYHDAVGDKAIGFVKVGRNVGVSSRPLNGGTLGAPGHQQVDRWELDYTASYIQIKILGSTIAKMATARQAAVRAVEHEVSGALIDLKKDLQRQLYGDGTGIIAYADDASASTTLGLRDDTTANVLASNDTLVRGWLAPGMYIDVGTTGDADTVAADLKITAVSLSDSNPTLTVASAVTTTEGTHVIGRAGNRSASDGSSYESNGLANLVDSSGEFAAINASSVPEWKASEVAANAQLSRAHMQQVWREIAQYGNQPNWILTSLEHQEDYYNLLQSQVRFAGDTNLASGKVDGPTFNGVPVSADPDCPRQVMYFVDKNELFLVSAGDIKWQNVNTGGDILDWVQNEDAFQARAAMYFNLGTTKRRAHGKLTGLTV